MQLDTAADQLYTTPPADFVARRSELAAEAERSGDKATAAAIKKLRKPTLGAWLANLLVHRHKDQTDELLRLGELLRNAQLNLAGPEMRRLAQQRREVIGTLVAEARAMARGAGQPVTDDAARDLETTLSAALADEGAADALRAGRLTSALEHTGFGPLELVPGKGMARPEPDRQPARMAPAKPDARSAADERRRQRQEVAQQTLRDAETAVSDAAQALEDQGRELVQLQQERDERRKEVSELERQLEDAKAAAASSDGNLRRAQAARRDTERVARTAAAAIARAETKVTRLARSR